MPRVAPSQVRRFIASIPVIVLLTPLSPALAQQKPAPPPPHSQTQLEDRVKELETRLNAAEQKAVSAAMEKDYILRTQNHYESYYKEVFSTQTHILWTIGLTATLLSITLTAVFFVAGRFGFNIFDRKIDLALKEATAQLRTEFTEMLGKETQALREANAAQLKALEDGLTKRITEQEQDLQTRSDFQFLFAQAVASAADNQWTDARNGFRSALRKYKSGKLRKLIEKKAGVTAARNIFVALKKEDEANALENAKKELADEFYNDLDDELALAAIDIKWLAPLVAERNSSPSPPVAAESKTSKGEPNEPPPPATPKQEQ